ncbi:MAG: hypothetical protein PHT07_24870 [Paludibacter sp.]|nr:hypothetical protein [Paludibacter sp.]
MRAELAACGEANIPYLPEFTYDYLAAMPQNNASKANSNSHAVSSLSNGIYNLVSESELKEKLLIPLESKINLHSTFSIADESVLTRGLQRSPEVRRPKAVVAQTHTINIIDSDAVVIQIWEGCIQSVNEDERSMRASLNAKMGVIPEHVANIDLQWVSEQDQDLVKPGAVFYLTLFKRVKRGGSIENSQELRFRRRPNWSKTQIMKINNRADMFMSKLKTKSLAD